MAHTLSPEGRRELIGVVRARYREATRVERRRLLDEFVALSGYHRKHAIRMLRDHAVVGGRAGPRPRLYDEAVREALVVLWEASDRICGKRLKPLLPALVSALERHGHLAPETTIRDKLLAVSAATIDRLLIGPRTAARGTRGRRGALPRVRRQVPVRTFADWQQPDPGFMEADLVAHCGDSVAGSFAYTLSLTDIASGWTECAALVVREGSLIVEALERLRTTMPFPLRGLDTDNGSEFINEDVLAYCRTHAIEFTRSRPYRKNDQAWIEQKNGAVVRRLVGYGRLEGLASAEVLARLYAASRLFVNFFQPSFKLAEKTRAGARVAKRYHPPATPCARLLAAAGVSEAMKQRLVGIQAELDPLQLLDEIRAVQHHLAGLARGEPLHVLPHRHADLDQFLRSLATAWHAGEVRPTHQPVPRPHRHWRTRRDPFELVWPQVLAWLEADPDQTGADLLERLRTQHPDTLGDAQLRTLQRRLKDWRRTTARRLVFAGHAPSLATIDPATTVGNTADESSGSITS